MVNIFNYLEIEKLLINFSKLGHILTGQTFSLSKQRFSYAIRQLGPFKHHLETSGYLIVKFMIAVIGVKTLILVKVVRDPCQKITLLLLKSKSVRVIVPESCF